MEDLPVGAEVVLKVVEHEGCDNCFSTRLQAILMRMFVSESSVLVSSEKTERMFNSKE